MQPSCDFVLQSCCRWRYANVHNTAVRNEWSSSVVRATGMSIGLGTRAADRGERLFIGEDTV